MRERETDLTEKRKDKKTDHLMIPEPVQALIFRLEERGYSAWAVGGCVRDSILGRVPEDWDVTTSALPDQVRECFPDCPVIETGLRHGTVTVILSQLHMEVTTYRVDGAYADHRHPDQVRFVADLEEDLARRDFTINAMAYHPRRGLADPFGGRRDLERGLLRCVGEPVKRLEEDALRIMRALRFAAVYDFRIEEEAERALRNCRELLKRVAAERIQVELNKLLCGSSAEAILNGYPEVLAVFIPEIEPMVGFEQYNRHHCFDVWRHTARCVAEISPRPVLRLTMLLHDIGKPSCFTRDRNGVGHFYGHPKVGTEMTAHILKRLRYDNETGRQVKELVRYHDVRLGEGLKGVRRLLAKVGEERYRQLLLVKRADALGQSTYHRTEKLELLRKMETGLEQVIREGQCFARKDLEVDGRALMGIGIPTGPELGRILKELFAEVVDGTLENEREALLERAGRLKR